jgi:peptide/nickel transport system substrate-binding protein
MENRFGVKDFVILILLVAVIVMVSLCMAQYDRQWEVINQANNQLRDQTKDLASIRRMLEQGVSLGEKSGGDDLTVGFDRVKKTHSNPDYAPGDSIVNTFLAPPIKLTPLVSSDAGASAVESYVLESLCVRDPETLAWLPRLAKSWHVSDDQLTIEFDLRKGVTFSDGEPFTADDVVYTMNLALNPDIEAEPIRTYLDKFDHVEKTGDYSVRFKFKSSYFKSFDTVASLGIQSRKFYSQFDAKTYNESTGLLMGTGPYRLTDPKGWRPEPGKPVELIRNERYWGVAPGIDRIIWKVIGNPSARITAFRNGETDSYSPAPEQYDDLLKDSKLLARTQHFDLSVPTTGYTYIGWNEMIDGKPTRFADKRVRLAMTELLDRQTICDDILHKYASVISSGFSKMTGQADPAIDPWPYDPGNAQQLLAAAGYHRENDTLIGPDGQPFRFKLTYNSNNPVRTQIASFAKDAFAKAGIITDLDPSEWSVMLQRNKDHKLDAMIIGWTGGIEDDPYQIFSTSAISKVGSNTISYSDPELDKAMEAARAVSDVNKRMQLWHAVHRIIHEDQPYTFLFILHELDFVDGRFKGLEPTKLGLNSDSEWYVPAALQKYSQ